MPPSCPSFLLYRKGTDALMSSAWVAIKINCPEYEPHPAASEPREAHRNVSHEPLGCPGAPSMPPRTPPPTAFLCLGLVRPHARSLVGSG